MDVTISGDTINITKDDGNIVTISAMEIVSCAVHERPDKEVLNGVVNPATPYEQTTSPYQSTPTFLVRLKLTDQREEYFVMGKIANQGSWTNDATGAETARAAIAAIMGDPAFS